MLIVAVHATAILGADPKGSDCASITTLGQYVAPIVRSDLMVNASASCAATACHGGPRAGIANEFASRGSEYSLWIERDPHARSWRTICGENSLAILRRLKIIQADGQITNQAAYDNCLACHNSTGQFNTGQFSDARSGELIREGVGCNSCHGPSELWKSTHYQSTWRPSGNSANSTENGFVPADNMFARARMCASCHIGDQDRDMNHDIIAAGHPVLYYEFASYHQRLPKHWRDPESADSKRYESTQWFAGQVAALDASLTLLEARAKKALPTSQWPEFASYECSACHQKIRPGSVDYSIDRKDAGVAKLSRWNSFGVSALLDARQSTGNANTVDQQLVGLIAELDRVASLTPNSWAEQVRGAEQVAGAAKSVRLQLDRWLNAREDEKLTADQLRDILTRAGERPELFANWESATQFYLASVAARAAWLDGADGNSLSTARQLRSVLTFEPGTSQQQLKLWQATAGFKSLPIHAGIQHWDAISSTPTK